jgi:hypothetical protein
MQRCCPLQVAPTLLLLLLLLLLMVVCVALIQQVMKQVPPHPKLSLADDPLAPLVCSLLLPWPCGCPDLP